MHQISAVSGDDAYLQAIDDVIYHGDVCAPRDMPIRELLDTTIQIDDPLTAVPVNVGRKLNLKIGAVEYLQLLGGYSSLTQLNLASNGRFTRFSDGGKLLGAYGPRLYDQLPRVIEKLTQDQDSRQAMAVIWRPDELSDPSRDVPCTVYLLFRVRDGKLSLKTHMRSNDAWLGFPYDVYMFTRLQITVAWAMKLPLGPYVHHVDSFHIYENDVDGARNLSLSAELRDQPPAIMTHSSVVRKDDRASLYVGRFKDASRVARAISFPHLYDRVGRYTQSFAGPVAWYASLVPQLDENMSLCELGCRYEFTGESTWPRICPNCHAENYQRWKNRQKSHRIRRLGGDSKFDDIVKRQGGRCLICRKEAELVIDHCHETETFRGLICNSCNWALGNAGDDPEVLRRMVAYLEGGLNA